MSVAMPKVVLLPGLDGTGWLFKDFADALPREFGREVVRYPADRNLSYAELAPFVWASLPASGPFVLLAESFSTPLAIQCVAANPPNLKGLVLCAGFVKSPMPTWTSALCSFLAPIMFSIPPRSEERRV